MIGNQKAFPAVKWRRFGDSINFRQLYECRDLSQFQNHIQSPNRPYTTCGPDNKARVLGLLGGDFTFHLLAHLHVLEPQLAPAVIGLNWNREIDFDLWNWKSPPSLHPLKSILSHYIFPFDPKNMSSHFSWMCDGNLTPI